MITWLFFFLGKQIPPKETVEASHNIIITAPQITGYFTALINLICKLKGINIGEAYWN